MKKSGDEIAPVGVVIIGRNEGDRLKSCISSVLPQADHVVYVDSGSTDNSVALAQSLGCSVIELDMQQAFTAGRARNAGFAHLLKQHPKLPYVQFIDGDCILDSSWVNNALAKMAENATIAIVCGRRRERFPDASIYNKLCDMEWDTPIGQAAACGGDFLVRVTAYQQVGGFDESFAAGEEPELCLRLREEGFSIWRIAAEMTLHDAAMTRFSQWWRRNMRSGSAYAQSAWTHGGNAEKYNLRESISIWIWAALIPLAAIVLLPFTFGTSLFLFGLYPLLGWRIYKWRRSVGDDSADARLYSLFCVLGKFPQVEGQARFLAKRESKLIEYKGIEETTISDRLEIGSSGQG